jgi:hypothetical protein
MNLGLNLSADCYGDFVLTSPTDPYDEGDTFVLDTAQESEMNARGNYFFLAVVNQT